MKTGENGDFLMKRLRILHVINIGGLGGAEKLLLQLLPALNRSVDIECLIFFNTASPAAASKLAEELTSYGIRVKKEGYHSTFEKSIRKKIREVVADGEYDLVHSHLKHADLWLAMLKKLSRFKTPVVSTMHGYNDAYENQYGFAVKKKIFVSPYYLLSKAIFSQLDGFILISNIIRDFFRKTRLLPSVPQEVVYHGYDLQLMSAENEISKPFEGKIAIPGRLIFRKGHRFAIEAFRKVREEHPGITLHIYGEGSEREVLQQQVEKAGIEQAVFFHGYVHELGTQLKQMDIMLVPSLWEGFGLVFLDAFAAGIPVLAFDLPAGNEIVRNEYSGLLATPYSADSMAEQMRRLIEDAPLRQQLIANGRHELKIRFNMERMTEDYISFYHKIIHQHSRV